MCNCFTGILGSKSSKTDVGSGDSYTESLWDIISLSLCPGGKRRRNSRCHFVEGALCPPYGRWQIITQRERTTSRLKARLAFSHGVVSERHWRRRSPSFVVWILCPSEHHKKQAYLLYQGSKCTGELMTLWGSRQQCSPLFLAIPREGTGRRWGTECSWLVQLPWCWSCSWQIATIDENACKYLLSHYLAGPNGVPNVSFSHVLYRKRSLTALCERRFYKAVIKEFG